MYAASDGGAGLVPVGLSGHHVAGLATNRGSTELYAVSYGRGIYWAKIPTQ